MDANNTRKTVITFIAIALIALVVVGAVAAMPKKHVTASTDTSAPSATTSTPDSSSSSATTTATSFKDGSYTATGSYESPGGGEDITVHVTLQNNVITATSADSGAHDSTAVDFQSLFISNYKSQVVGKNINDVRLSRVSGSSLTSQGFNNAIEQIKRQAAA